MEANDKINLYASDNPVDSIMVRALQSISTLHAVVLLLPPDDVHIELIQRMTRQLNEVEAALLQRQTNT